MGGTDREGKAHTPSPRRYMKRSREAVPRIRIKRQEETMDGGEGERKPGTSPESRTAEGSGDQGRHARRERYTAVQWRQLRPKRQQQERGLNSRRSALGFSLWQWTSCPQIGGVATQTCAQQGWVGQSYVKMHTAGINTPRVLSFTK